MLADQLTYPAPPSVQLQPVKRGRGRPKKTAEDSTLPPKRPRGRSKKTAEDSTLPAKRSRGRPKKTAEDSFIIKFLHFIYFQHILLPLNTH